MALLPEVPIPGLLKRTRSLLQKRRSRCVRFGCGGGGVIIVVVVRVGLVLYLKMQDARRRMLVCLSAAFVGVCPCSERALQYVYNSIIVYCFDHKCRYVCYFQALRRMARGGDERKARNLPIFSAVGTNSDRQRATTLRLTYT